MDKLLRDNLLIQIATCYPFGVEDVAAVYEAVKSFDATIKVCELAVELGYSSPVIAIRAIQGRYDLSPPAPYPGDFSEQL